MDANQIALLHSRLFAFIRGSAGCAIQTMGIQEGLLLKATVPATQP
jgi:hypothetical protein